VGIPHLEYALLELVSDDERRRDEDVMDEHEARTQGTHYR
jgi:hypothetical protein